MLADAPKGVAIGTGKPKLYKENKNPLKTIKCKLQKLVNPLLKKTIPSPIVIPSQTPSTKTSGYQESIFYNKSSDKSSDDDKSDLDLNIKSDITQHSPSRSYKLLSTQHMSSTPIPSYYFTDEQHKILSNAWNVILNIDDKQLFNQYTKTLQNESANYDLDRVTIKEQFSLIFSLFNKIITENDYKQYGEGEDGIINVTALVLRMLGIRNAMTYKIIPSDYKLYGICFFKLFDIYLYQDPESIYLLNECWKFIYGSITIAFDFKE